MHSFTAIKGRFGALDTFLVQIPPEEIPDIVGHDPRGWVNKTLPKKTADLYEAVQRASNKPAIEGMEEYAATYSHPNATGIGAFPALSVGLRTPPKFKSYESKEIDREGGDVGKLTMVRGQDNALYLDGVKRACALLNKLEEGLLGPVTVGVMIFAPSKEADGQDKKLTDADFAQLFYDFNAKSVGISKPLAAIRDSRDPYIQLAHAIADAPVIRDNGGVDKKSASIGGKSTSVAVLTDIVTFVKGAVDGEPAIEHQKTKVDNSALTSTSQAEYIRLIPVFIQGIVDGMTREVYRDHTHHVHLFAPVWAALGVLFHDLHTKLGIKNDAEMHEFGKKFGLLSWDRDPHGRLKEVLRPEIKGKQKPWRSGTADVRRHLTPLLRDELGIAARVGAWKPEKQTQLEVAAE